MAFCLISTGGFFMSMPSTTPSRRPALASRRPRFAATPILLAAFVAMGGRAARVDAAQGDLNCDGVVSLLDVPPFVLGLIDPAAYAVAFPACDVTRADVDGNAENDGRDIKAFVTLLLSPPPQEIVLRDSIGPDNQSTNGNIYYASFHDGFTNSKWLAAIPVTNNTSNTIKLTSYRMILGQAPLFSYSAFDWNLRVWSNEAALIASPLSGNLFNHTFDVPTSGPTPFGTGYNGRPTWETQFDLSPLNVTIPPSASRMIVVHISVPSQLTQGSGGVQESWETGQPKDKHFNPSYPSGWRYTDDSFFPNVHFQGRYAIEVRAEVVS